MPIDRFGGRMKHVSVHELPTRPSHATSKRYVDSSIRQMMVQLQNDFREQFMKLDSNLKKFISISIAEKMLKNNSIQRLRSVTNKTRNE